MLSKILMLTALSAALAFAANPAMADNGKSDSHSATHTEASHPEASHPEASHPETHPTTPSPARVDSSPDKSGSRETHSAHVDLIPDSSLIN